MTIPLINIQGVRMSDVRIPNIFVPNWQTQQPNVDHLVPPVVLNIGIPIVDMPGCVKAHKDNQYHKSGLPVDKNIVQDDPDKAMIVCDATVPSYDAMNYEPEQLTIVREVEPPPVSPPPEPPEAEVPDTGDVAPETEFLCPAPNQPRVGDLTQKGDERVIGHEEQEIDGVKTCVVLYEDTTLAEKLLPSTNQVTTTTAIAVVATAAAAATPLILRVVKPILTKIWKTIQKKLGKKVDMPTRAEIKANEYRAKKGLPPLKKK